MPPDRSEAGQGMLEDARRAADMSVRQLWLDYLGLGGNATLAEVGSWLCSRTEPGAVDHDLVAQALNERYIAMQLDDRVPYAEQLR